MDVGETQKKLSQWAEQERAHRFYDLYHLLYHDDWLRTVRTGQRTSGYCTGVHAIVKRRRRTYSAVAVCGESRTHGDNGGLGKHSLGCASCPYPLGMTRS